MFRRQSWVQRSRNRAVATRHLFVEQLEDRRVMAVTDLASRASFPLAVGSTGAGSSTLQLYEADEFFNFTTPDSAQHAASADGRYVAFVSSAGNLVSGFNLVLGVSQVYRFDRVTQQVTLVSVNAAGTGGGDQSSSLPTISADGTRIGFLSRATNLHPLDTDTRDDVYVREIDATPATFLASVDAAGTVKANHDSLYPTLSANGLRIAFSTFATNLHPLDTDTNQDIYVREVDDTPTTFLASVNAAGTVKGNGISTDPTLSADGTRVAFETTATNLHPLDTTSSQDIYVRELDATPTTLLASVNAAGTVRGNSYSINPVISADGTRVAFSSAASNLSPLDADSLVDIFVREIDATPTTFLVSVNAAGTVKGNADSTIAVISGDGTRVAFATAASNLDPLDTDSLLDIYVRELDATPTTFLASVNAAGTVKGNADSTLPTISADGVRVGYMSQSTNLHPLDTDALQDIYVRELDGTPTTFLASINAGGTVKSNQNSSVPAISSDGSSVFFHTLGSNLVASDVNSANDVFVRDLNSPTTQLASPLNPLAASATPNAESRLQNIGKDVTNADGRYVVFVSRAANLVSGLTLPAGVQQIYRYDRVTQQVALVSVNAAGTGGGNGDSASPVINADGTRIAFQSFATNLHALDTDNRNDVYVRELDATPMTFLASVTAAGTKSGLGDSFSPSISADGLRVAFGSQASLDPLDNDLFELFTDVYVRELDDTPTTIMASVTAAGTARNSGNSDDPIISADGKRVVFISRDRLDPLDTDDLDDIYVRDLSANTTFLVNVNAAGTVKANGASSSPTISADGTRVAFVSQGSNLDPLDPDANEDVYVRELDATPTTILVNVNAAGTVKGNGTTFQASPVISADGLRVAFVSAATNLHPVDTDTLDDIYVRELDATPTTFLVSVNAAGTVKGNRDSQRPSISADGTRIAFESSSTNLDPFANGRTNIFLRELDATPTTRLMSINAAGTGAGNNDTFIPGISADGNVVAFYSRASDLVVSDFNVAFDVFLRNLNNIAPTAVTAAAVSPNPSAGIKSQLSVLGTDDGGEANLTYTWSTITKPAGAADPTFSANGTNGAKNTTVTVGAAGSYLLRVTISDGSLTVTSDVTLNVNFTLGQRSPLTADVDGNGLVNAQDILAVISYMAASGPGLVSTPVPGGTPAYYYDVVADGIVNVFDILGIIGHMAANPPLVGEGEGLPAATKPQPAYPVEGGDLLAVLATDVARNRRPWSY